jgi:hypothetical protein
MDWLELLRREYGGMFSGSNNALKTIGQCAYPRSPGQIEEETAQLHALLQGKLTQEESGNLLQLAMAALVISECEAGATARIIECTRGRLTRQEVHMVYTFVKGVCGPIAAGVEGSSPVTAVVIDAGDEEIGVSAEYSYIERLCGKRGVDFALEMQMKTDRDGRTFDVMVIRMKDGSGRCFWFDITSFFGKW